MLVLRVCVQLCMSEWWEVAKFATRALRVLGGDGCEEIKGLIAVSMSSLDKTITTLPSVLSCLSEAARSVGVHCSAFVCVCVWSCLK